MDPLITQTGAAQGAQGVGLAEGPAQAGKPSAAPEDAARFQEALGVTPPQAPDQLQGSSPLAGLDKLSADMRATKTNIVQGADGLGDMGNLLRLQFEVANLTTTQTMVGQVGQKSSQGTQQLLKGQ